MRYFFKTVSFGEKSISRQQNDMRKFPSTQRVKHWKRNISLFYFTGTKSH